MRSTGLLSSNTTSENILHLARRAKQDGVIQNIFIVSAQKSVNINTEPIQWKADQNEIRVIGPSGIWDAQDNVTPAAKATKSSVDALRLLREALDPLSFPLLLLGEGGWLVPVPESTG